MNRWACSMHRYALIKPFEGFHQSVLNFETNKRYHFPQDQNPDLGAGLFLIPAC